MFVIGEAGIGKSRLAEEAVVEARRAGYSVLSGRAVQTHTFVAFRPISEALFSYFREGGPPDIPDLEPFRPVLARLVPEWRHDGRPHADESIVMLSEAILRLLRAVGRRRGCLLVLEDLHWGDPETLAIVEYLTRNVTSEPVVCLCTLRSEDRSAALALAHTLSAQRAAATISLVSLDAEHTASMARACLSVDELPDAIGSLMLDHADGLPFLVEELLAGAADSGALVQANESWTTTGSLQPDVPLTFIDSVDGRLATLGNGEPVILAASVLGRRFEWTLLAAITGLDEGAVLAALRDAVAAQLLVAEASPMGSFRFRHALTREAVARRLLPIERGALCRRAVDAVVSTHPDLPGEWCELAANLADEGGDRGRAATLLLESGRRSLTRGALASAEIAFERAGTLAADPVIAADAADGLCEALSLAGKIDQALEAGLRLRDALLALSAPPTRLGALHLRLAEAAATACRWDLAEEHAGLARQHAPEGAPTSLEARADIIAAQVALGREDHERARGLARSGLAVAEGLSDHELRCEALEIIGRCARVRDADEAANAFEQARAIADEHGLVVSRIRAQFELSTIDLLSLRSNDRLLATRELALAAGALATGAQVDLHLAVWYVDQFEPDKAIGVARRSSEIAGRFHLDQLLARSLLYEAAAQGQLGRRDTMEALIREALSLAGDDPGAWGCAWAFCRARLSLTIDNQRRALRELDTGMEHMRQAPTIAFPERGLWALLHAVAGSDGDAACAEVRESGGLAHRLNRGYVQLAQAVLLGRSGRKDEAERCFAIGDSELAPATWYRHHARRLVADAAITDGWGDPGPWMQQALVIFEEHHQDRLAAACRSLLHKAGVPVPRRRGDQQVPAALRESRVTRREFEVLTLLADGLSNKEISTRLYMSPRTVERHVANLALKTGLRTRSELIAFAARVASN